MYRIYTKPSDKRGRIPTIPVDKKPEVPDGTTFDNYRASYELLNRFNADVARARWNFKNAVVKSRKDLFVETEPDGLSAQFPDRIGEHRRVAIANDSRTGTFGDRDEFVAGAERVALKDRRAG